MARIVSYGSLPGLRAAAKPMPISYASADPKMNPRASAPSTMSGFSGRAKSASSPTACRNAAGSATSGMMSLKTIPGFGNPGMSRMYVRRSAIGAQGYRPGRSGHEGAAVDVDRLARHTPRVG